MRLAQEYKRCCKGKVNWEGLACAPSQTMRDN